jgi:hypothetical protein
MPRGDAKPILQHIRKVAAAACDSDSLDRELLDGFCNQADEVAFTALVHRHGPMVLRLGEGKDQAGPAVYRFKVEVPSKKTGQHEVVEERVHVDSSKVVGKIDEDVLREYLANPAPTAKVKEALQQVLDKSAKLRATMTELAEQQAAMKVLTEDQARVRENLKIVPRRQTSTRIS